MLTHCDINMAVEYYHQVSQSIISSDEGMQLAFVELVRKDCHRDGSDKVIPMLIKAKYIQTILALLAAPSATVRFEAASTLVLLTSHTSAVKSAASCYIDLALKASDNNVKLIVLSNLSDLSSDKILQDLVMDVLRIVTSPDLSVRDKTLQLALDLTTGKSVGEVVSFLKKELAKTHLEQYEKTNEYRQLLIKAIHSCAIKFPQIADDVVLVLMDFVSDANTASAVDVIAFVKEVMETFPHLRHGITERLIDLFADLKTARVLRGALWILGEYASTPEALEKIKAKIKLAIGGPVEELEDEVKTEQVVHTKTRVLADGTYATESAFSSPAVKAILSATAVHHLRSLLNGGDFFIAAVIATTLTKLSMRYYQDQNALPLAVNAFKTESMLIMTTMIRLGKSLSTPIDEDSYARIMTCIRVLANHPQDLKLIPAFTLEPRKAFSHLLQARESEKSHQPKTVSTHVEDLISFRLLKGKKHSIDTVFNYLILV